MRKNKTMKGGGWDNAGRNFIGRAARGSGGGGQGLNLLGQLTKTSKPQRWAGPGSNLFGRAAKTSNPQQRAVPDLNLVVQAKKITSKPQWRGTFMNPQKVNMAQNVFGSARGMFDRLHGISLKEHITRGAKHLSKMANDGSLAELVDNNRVASKLVNNSFNALGNSSITKSFNAGIRKFSTGSSEPH